MDSIVASGAGRLLGQPPLCPHPRAPGLLRSPPARGHVLGAGPIPSALESGFIMASRIGLGSLPVTPRQEQRAVDVTCPICWAPWGGREGGFQERSSSTLKRDAEREAPFPACSHCCEDVNPEEAAEVLDSERKWLKARISLRMSEQKKGKNPDITGLLSSPIWELLLVCAFFYLKNYF